MNLDALPTGKHAPDDVNVVIEVPIGGGPIKYEMHKASGALVVDRFLHTSMRYPGNYGFIPHTLSSDGDPCDVIVANTRALVPGAVISCRIVGALLMEDEAGLDEKLLGVPVALADATLRTLWRIYRPPQDHVGPDRTLLRTL
jgi:inorganic pyrophosphatase